MIAYRIVMAVLLVVWIGQLRPTRASEHTTASTLSLEAPARSMAGEPVTIVVRSSVDSDGAPLVLTVQGSYGVNIYRSQFTNGQATITLSREQTLRTGLLNVIAEARTVRVEATIDILPQIAIDPVQPLVGARSIVADGEDWSMTVVIPQDRYGNPVAEGTEVDIRALHPSGNLDAAIARVQHLVAWRRVYSETVAGKTVINASVGTAYGPEVTLLEVPGWPIDLSIQSDAQTAVADGRALIDIRTGVLRDRFNNIVSDGTHITFLVDAPDGRRRIPSFTLNGIAEAQIQAPTQPGLMRIQTMVPGLVSEPVTISLTEGPVEGSFPVTIQLTTSGDAVAMTAGPLISPLKQYIADGTRVSFVIYTPSGAQINAEGVAEGGYAFAELRIASLDPGLYQVRAIVGAGRGTGTFSVPWN